MSGVLAQTPEPPYYAVIFTSLQTDDTAGYARMSERMVETARRQPGCLGYESARDSNGLGITVSYWQDEEAIAAWKANVQHMVAQRMGIEHWYAHYELRIARVERAYSGPTGRSIQ